MFYRYRRLSDRNIKALEKDEFWISSADTFNDFFDIQIAYDRNKIVDSFCSNEAIKNSFLEFKKKYQYNLKTDKEYFENFIDYICQCFVFNVKRKVLICSLTKNEDNPVMWSHYANDNTGFVLGYGDEDIEKLCGSPINTHCFKAEYEGKPFDATTFIIQSIVKGINNSEFNMGKAYFNFENLMFHGDCDKHFYLRKTKDWGYEAEYRFMQYYGPSIGNEHQIIGIVRPSKLIIGQKMPISDKLNIIRLCSEKNIPLFKAEICWDINAYGIRIMPFTSDDLNDILKMIEEESKKLTFNKIE